MNGIDAMERYLVCQLAQVTLYPIADDFAERWSAALETGAPLPDVTEILEAAAGEDVPILTIASLDPYLRQCARDRRVPDPARVVTAIVHGFAEVRLALGRTCRCPLASRSWKPASSPPNASPSSMMMTMMMSESVMPVLNPLSLQGERATRFSAR